MAVWKTLPVQVPGDGEVVWVRLNYWFGPPFQAKWSDADLWFESLTGLALKYPFWTISRWRSL
jgi:hypothetical protein